VLQSGGQSAQDYQTENTRLAFLQSQVQSANGQTQAIQAAAQLASEMVSQMQLLRQAIVAQTNAEIVYDATQLQTQASKQAELGNVIQSGSTNVPPYGSSGDPLSIPNF
jgi:P-type conjugative transfer protein TrbJ